MASRDTISVLVVQRHATTCVLASDLVTRLRLRTLRPQRKSDKRPPQGDLSLSRFDFGVYGSIREPYEGFER